MAAAVGVALFLRLFHLAHQSLWVDEALTWSSSTVRALTLEDLLSSDHGPLVQLLLHAWTHAVGDSELALRLPSVLATVLLVPVFAGLARRLLGPRAWAPGAWLAALSPFLVWYGQEARSYSFALLFATLMAWAAVRWHERGGVADGVYLVLATWLGLLSNLNVPLVLPVVLAYVALPHGGRRGRPWAALAALAAVGVLESPWIVQYARRLAWHRLVPGRGALPAETPLRAGTTFSWGAYPFTLYTFSVGYTLGPTMESLHLMSPLRAALRHWPTLALVAATFGGLAVRGLGPLARRRAPLAFALGLVLAPMLFVTYFAVQNFKVFNPRYVSAGIAGYYLILLAGWLALGRAWRWLASALVLALWVWSLGNWYFVPAYGKEDYRGAVAWVAERIRPEDRLVATGSPVLLDYYWRSRRPAFVYYWLGFADRPERMRSRFSALVDSVPTAFVLVTRPYELDPAGRFEAYLRAGRGATLARFVGVNVYHLAGSGGAPLPPGSAESPPGTGGRGGASSGPPMRENGREH